MDFSFPELFFVALIALFFLGPKELYAWAQKSGRFFARLRTHMNNMKIMAETTWGGEEELLEAEETEQAKSKKEQANHQEEGVEHGTDAFS